MWNVAAMLIAWIVDISHYDYTFWSHTAVILVKQCRHIYSDFYNTILFVLIYAIFHIGGIKSIKYLHDRLRFLYNVVYWFIIMSLWVPHIDRSIWPSGPEIEVIKRWPGLDTSWFSRYHNSISSLPIHLMLILKLI